MEEVRKELLNFFKNLKFIESTHKYYVDGKELFTSVSGVLKNFQKEENWDLILKKSAEKKGLKPEELKQQWDSKKDRACALGTEVHIFGELYPYDNTLKPKRKLEEAIVAFWKDVPEHIVPMIMELEMYHKEFMFGGTADIVLYNSKTNKIILGDYKTNEDLFKNFRGKKLVSPFNFLLDTNFNKYQLQLNIYKILLEQSGHEVESMKLVWLKRDGSYAMYDVEDYTEIMKSELNNLYK